jgi:lysophospholipid acyltransferase (LPLAT)-like uncharacterized protein
MAKVQELTFPQKLGIGLGLLVFRLLMSTVRVRFSASAKKVLWQTPQRRLFLIWHNRLAMALMVFARSKVDIPFTGLVSASRDGAMLTQVMRSFGVQVVRGSSSRRAVEATKELIQAVESGRNIVITPDGPRGPIYQVKEGTATIAQQHVGGVYAVGLSASRFWRFYSWDRFILPKPFSTITVDLIEQGGEITRESLEKTLLANNP